MIHFNDFVLNPGKFKGPQYNISPFSTEYIGKNYKILQSKDSVNEDLLFAQFGNHLFCDSGKSAISQVLKQYNLTSDDEVFIETTTGNKYISGCVTQEIEKVCKWSRQLSPRTKLIYVNHEFGIVHTKMDSILRLGLPVIEDVAMSMFSTDYSQKTGSYGDFAVFSLPKFFPMQYGGIIKINNEDAIRMPFAEDDLMSVNLKTLASHYLKDAESIVLNRIRNYQIFKEKLTLMGFKDRFPLQIGETPAVYMFSSLANYNFPGLKEFLQENGIECSVFYGENAFFVPIHQLLDEVDIDFIISAIEYYSNEYHGMRIQSDELGVTSL